MNHEIEAILVIAALLSAPAYVLLGAAWCIMRGVRDAFSR